MSRGIVGVVLAAAALARCAHGFSGLAPALPARARAARAPRVPCASAIADAPAAAGGQASSSTTEPLLLRAAKGQSVERPPVWMMRQAGRHMKIYRDLVPKYPTFRERSETAEVAYEISMQPYRAYGTDGVILFSDILTPLPGMGFDFDIQEKAGPVLPPVRTEADIAKRMKKLEPAAACPFTGEVLGQLRKEVGNAATVLGFIGSPYTLATYLVEGGTSKEYLEIKKMGFEAPQVLHKLLGDIADNIAEYAIYQIEAGAQVIQLFDSWAGHLAPRDYDTFAAPYQRRVIEQIKRAHPETPIIIYINKSGALLERMAQVGADIVSVDWTVTIEEARKRLGDDIGIQGNLDPAILLSDHATIKERTHEILAQAANIPKGHVMNLGHGIDATTPEENSKFFVDTVQAYRY